MNKKTGVIIVISVLSLLSIGILIRVLQAHSCAKAYIVHLNGENPVTYDIARVNYFSLNWYCPRIELVIIPTPRQIGHFNEDGDWIKSSGIYSTRYIYFPYVPWTGIKTKG